MGKTLYDIITKEGQYTPFGLPATEELRGRSAGLPEGSKIPFGDELAVKCDDDLFLARAGEGLLLVKELADESLEAVDAARAAASARALPEALEGWETDLCFASGYVLTAAFRENALTLSASPEPDLKNLFTAPKAQGEVLGTFALKVCEIDNKRFILHLPETGETVIFNGRRFLLYAILRGRITGGFVEIPPKEA